MSGPVIALVAGPGAAPGRASVEALTVAREVAAKMGAALEACLAAERSAAAAAASALAGTGVVRAVVVEDDRLTPDHPGGWASAVAQIAEARGASAVIGAGTERGNDLLARVAARLDVPLAANCLTVEPGETWSLARQRWAGSLIEVCRLDAPVKLVTV